ncbi:MAG TPA: arsenite methyltransferase [candidate division Zixibacteria bacterium]|nr:arsenite methyltransferase [candidate division Zixibacteria bacterium]
MSDTKNPDDVKKFVRDLYGKIAEGKADGCGCCSSPSPVELEVGYSQQDLENIPGEAVLGLGCGNPTALADIKEGETVLDLGSGGGIDCFLAARLTGKTGKVIGVDMTEKMINLARKNAAEGGYDNVEFRLGELENLPLENNSIDLIISNCVINLATDKSKAFSEAFRVLKPGGRMMVSDLVVTEKLPEHIRRSLEAWAGCIAGAMVREDYLNAIETVGFENISVEKEHAYIEANMTDELKGKILSVSVKAFKPV